MVNILDGQVKRLEEIEHHLLGSSKSTKSFLPDQMTTIKGKQFGGLLNIKVQSMSSDFSKWLMRCYNSETSEIVIPRRGSIPVNADSVQRFLIYQTRRGKLLMR